MYGVITCVIILGAITAIMIAACRAVAREPELAAGSKRVSLAGVHAFARRTIRVSLGVLGGYAIAFTALGQVMHEPLTMLIAPGIFATPIAVYVAMLTWRAHAALSCDAATANGNVVFVWRRGRLRTWLYAEPERIAQLGLPSARVRRRP